MNRPARVAKDQIKSCFALFGLLCMFALFGLGTGIVSPSHRGVGQQASSAVPSQTEQKEPEPEGFWIRFLTDPVAFFTAVLALLTAILARTAYVQIGLLIKADDTARLSAEAAIESNRITRELFSDEQRPWMKITVRVGERPMINDDGSVAIRLLVASSNIGKSPAFDAADGTGGNVHVGYEGCLKYFEDLRAFSDQQVESHGLTVFPDEEDTWACNATIPKAVVEENGAFEVFYFAVSYKYRLPLTENVCETSRMYVFGLPKEPSDDFAPLKLRLFKEYVT